MKRLLILATAAAISLACLPGAAQQVSAVAKLDLTEYTGTWYEIARMPVKRERRCLSDEMVLYALNDKRDSFQMVTSCQLKAGNSDFWNASGKADAAADGRLKLSRFLILSTPYWVLATGPGYSWALVGSPNRKSLWILSRTPTMTPETLAGIEAEAKAEGFDTGRLMRMVQH